MAAERIVKSEKLLKLQVDVGEPTGTRQIVAGIGKVYTPEELIGRKVVVVKNLKPAKLMGEQSNGMLLAASDESGALELLTAPAALPPGSGIS
jgi:methionyl-tRNA synthetase